MGAEYVENAVIEEDSAEDKEAKADTEIASPEANFEDYDSPSPVTKKLDIDDLKSS